MKTFVLALFVLGLAACSNKHAEQLAKQIAIAESQRGHNIVSYEITSQKDSLDKWYVVDYTAIVDDNKKSSGHLVFVVTPDGYLTR